MAGSQAVYQQTMARVFKKLKATNFTTTSFAATLGASTKTRPVAGDDVGLIDFLSGERMSGVVVPNSLLIRLFGAGADGNTFNARFLGWRQESTTNSWESVLLAEVVATLGTGAGAAGCAITATDLVVDTISLTHGNDDIDLSIVSPALNVHGAYLKLENHGSGLVTVHFDMVTATSGNALVSEQ